MPRPQKASAKSGLKPDGFVVVRERAVQVAFACRACEASVVKGFGEVGLKADGLAIEAQLLIEIYGIKASLEPLLGSQFFFRDRWGLCDG